MKRKKIKNMSVTKNLFNEQDEKNFLIDPEKFRQAIEELSGNDGDNDGSFEPPEQKITKHKSDKGLTL